MSDYYTPSGNPATSSTGASSVVRDEFSLISAGFDKLPKANGNSNLPVFVNSTGTALVPVSLTSARSILAVPLAVFPGVIPLTGVKFPAGDGHNLAVGDNDLYTVPAGKRAMIWGGVLYNTSLGNISWYIEVKISGTYYRLTNTTTTSTVSQAITTGISYIAEAGEIIAINTATNNGLNVGLRIIEFDATCPVRSPKLTSLPSSDNTVYTVPANNTAILNNVTFANSDSQALFYVNASGGTTTVSWNVVPSGGSAGSTNQITASTTAPNNARQTLQGSHSLDAGDFVSINTNNVANTQFAWVNVMEIAT